MRILKLLIFLTILLIYPTLTFAQGNLYVSEHNITYNLLEGDAQVTEKIRFILDYEKQDKIYFTRDLARDVEVKTHPEVPVSISEKYPTVIGIDLENKFYKKINIELSYKRSDLVTKRNNVYVFDGVALGKNYPWAIYNANIVFTIPNDYQFGKVKPAVTLKERSSKEISYHLDLFNNLTEITNTGFQVHIEYGEFTTLANLKISKAKVREHEALLALSNANRTIRDSRKYVSNLSEAERHYNEAVEDLESYYKNIELAESTLASGNRAYEAYLFADQANAFAKNSSISATIARDLAESRYKKAIEDKLQALEGANRSKEVPSTEGTKTGKDGTDIPWIYLLLIIPLAGFLYFYYVKKHPEKRPTEPKAISSIKAYRSINDLKHKEFEGFDIKINRVKKGVDIASKIKQYRQKKEELEKEAEKLRKSMFDGKISKKKYQEEIKEYLMDIDEIDSKINGLEKKLNKLKEASKPGKNKNEGSKKNKTKK